MDLFKVILQIAKSRTHYASDGTSGKRTKTRGGESMAQPLEFWLLVYEIPGSNPGWGKLAGIFTLGLGLKCLKLIGNICKSNSNSHSPP